MDNSKTSLKMLLADTFCFAIPPATDCEAFCLMVLLLSVFSKYSVINFSKAAISSKAVWLISVTAAEFMLTSEMLLELLDFLELAVDWPLWLESVLVDPMDRELACLGRVLKPAWTGPVPGPPKLNVFALLTLELGCWACVISRCWCCAFLCGWNLVLSFCFAVAAAVSLDLILEFLGR